MRRALASLLVLAALPAAAAADPAAPAFSKARGTWIGVDHALYVEAAWTPPTTSSDVTMTVRQGTSPLRTLSARGWVIGRKTFSAVLPASIASGTDLTVVLKLKQGAVTASRTIHVTVR